MTAAAAVMAVVAVVLFVVAPLTVGTIAPGFAGNPARTALYVELFRLMCVTPVIFAVSIALGEILVANRRFLHYGLAPILYNAGIVGGTLLLAGSLGVHAAAIGAVAGALLHLAIRVVGIVRIGFPLRPAVALRTPEFLEFLRLMAPKMASHPIEPLTFLFFTALATTIADGGATAISFARNFQSVPVSLIGVAFSLAVFPTLSAHAAAGDRSAFTAVLRTNLATIAAGSIAAAVALAVVAELAIGMFLGGGRFDAAAVARTAALLAAFAISVPLEALAHPLARAIYATRNTTWPVIGSILGLVVTVTAVLWLRPGLGLTAIPLGFAAGAATKLLVLGLAVGPRIRGIGAST